MSCDTILINGMHTFRDEVQQY